MLDLWSIPSVRVKIRTWNKKILMWRSLTGLPNWGRIITRRNDGSKRYNWVASNKVGLGSRKTVQQWMSKGLEKKTLDISPRFNWNGDFQVSMNGRLKFTLSQHAEIPFYPKLSSCSGTFAILYLLHVQFILALHFLSSYLKQSWLFCQKKFPPIFH